jgi:hypothetical protein
MFRHKCLKVLSHNREGMEWQLPIQKVEIGNINIGSPWAREHRREYEQKPMAPLSYFGTQFRIPFVSLLFPPLPVVEYNANTGKLVLDMSGTSLACIKMNTFQETLIGAIVYHQHGWFKSNFSRDDVKGGFQPIFNENKLSLYCPSASGQTQSAVRGIPIYVGGAWKTSFSAEDLAVGRRIRVAVKIHGISFLNSQDGTWSGRCRLQHRILGMITVVD